MKKKVKLLFATHLFYPAIGGVEIHIKHLSEGLVKRGYRVDVITTDAYSTEAFFLGDKRRIRDKEDTIDGVHVKRLGFRTFGAALLNKLCNLACRFKYPFNNWIRFLSFGPRNRGFIKHIMAAEPDIIFAAPLPTLNVYYAYKAAQKLNKPLIIIPSYHIFDPCCFYNQVFFKMMREADIVMAQSPMERDYLVKEGRIDKNRFIILPPFPLRENQLGRAPGAQGNKAEIRRRYGIVEGKVVLYLGQHGVHKRVTTLLEAMPYLWSHTPDVALVIAGGITDHTATLKKMAAQLDTGAGKGKVYFLDNFPADEKGDIFQMADIFITLSEMESFGIVLVEALNYGLPIIASKNGVARYIAEDGRHGILVEPRCVTEVAGALMEMLADNALRERFSRAATDRAHRVYHPQHILDKWEDVITNVLSNPRPR